VGEGWNHQVLGGGSVQFPRHHGSGDSAMTTVMAKVNEQYTFRFTTIEVMRAMRHAEEGDVCDSHGIGIGIDTASADGQLRART